MPEVSFDLPDPALAEHTWVLFDEHTPLASPPLGTALFSGPASAEQPGVPRSIRLNGYTYMRRGTAPGEGGPFGSVTLAQSVEEMRAWRTRLQPQVDDVVGRLQQFDPAAVTPGHWRRTLDAHTSLYWGVFGPIHREAVFPAHAVARAFQDLYTQRFGQERLGDAVALLQGMPNASLERAAMLWDLSRIVREDAELAASIALGKPAPDTEGGREFLRQFEALRQAFGATGEGFVEDQPTWGENDAIPLMAIRAYAGQPDGNGPLDSARRQGEHRDALEAELRALPKSDEQVSELLRLLPMAQELLPNLEDHNYYTDQRLNAASRARWLAIGGHLRERGLVQQADDVFYFQRDELIAALEGESSLASEELAHRRADLALWRSVSPPPVLGKPYEQSIDELPSEMVARASELRVVRGVGTSPGSYRGRARVIDAIEQAETLEPGDILVTRVTTPAWTPFFGVVSALVINVGGLLSHASVVAREFGLPAVVGTRDGTVRIPDGATITVDGTSGLVLVES